MTSVTAITRRTFMLAGVLAAAVALAASLASVRAADDEVQGLQAVIDAAMAQGNPISAEEFNAVVAPFFKVEKANTGGFQLALKPKDADVGHQLIVRRAPNSQATDVIMGYATKDSITGFLTSEDGKLRDAIRRQRGADSDFTITDETRELFMSEKRFWHAWVRAVAQ